MADHMNNKENQQAGVKRRLFLPAAFLLILFGLGAGTFLLHFDTFWGEIAWVQANCQTPAADKLETLISRWSADAASELILQEQLVELDGLAARVYGKHFVRDTEYSYSVVKDNHGWLQFITFAAELKPIVQNIAAYQALGVPK